MRERKKKESEREYKLKIWALNHSAKDIADQCNVTRGAIYQALEAERPIHIYVNEKDKISYVFEYRGKIPLFKFKRKEPKPKQKKRLVSRSLLHK